MRVALINTMDLKGGAARAAFRLHKGLVAAGVDSTYYVRDQTRTDPTIRRFIPDPAPAAAQHRAACKAVREAAYNAYAATRSPDIELFSQEQVDGDENFFVQMPRADVINLHWVAGFVDYHLFFTRRITRPVVWTLHDMNPFTGGCHYDQGCGKWSTQCAACPLLGTDDANDLSHRVFAAKAKVFAEWPAHMLKIVAPSRWLAEEARRSALLGKYEAVTIPNGVETDIFRPMDKAIARAALVVVGVALVGRHDEYGTGIHLARGFQHVGGAHDVDGQGIYRRAVGLQHQRLGGKMEDDFGICRGHGRLERRDIANIGACIARQRG